MHDIVPLDDGSVLLIDSPVREEPQATSQGVLSGGELVHFVVDAVAGGVTFEVLKRIASQLTRSESPTPVDATTVTDELGKYLLRFGQGAITMKEVRKVGDHGWTATGTVGGRVFYATSDDSGRVIHVRVE